MRLMQDVPQNRGGESLVMHQCMGSLWISLRDALRLCKILVKVPLVGDSTRRRKEIA